MLEHSTEEEIRRLIRLLDRKPSVYFDKKLAKMEDSKSALILAVEGDHLNIVKMLVNRVTDINARDLMGCSALVYAIRKQSVEVITILIENGANISSMNNHKTSVLMEACRHGGIEIVSDLMGRGASPDVNITNQYMDTALTMAARGHHTAVVNLLIKHGAHVNTQNSDGATALHYACQHNCLASARLLVIAGGDLFLKDRKRRTPLGRCPSEEFKKHLSDDALIKRYVLMMSMGKRGSPNLLRRLREEQIDVWRTLLLFF